MSDEIQGLPSFYMHSLHLSQSTYNCFPLMVWSMNKESSPLIAAELEFALKITLAILQINVSFC